MMGPGEWTAEDELAQSYRQTGYACRHLADWGLAHFGDRTNGDAYRRIVTSVGRTSPLHAVDKVHTDLHAQGFPYKMEAVARMFERYMADAERSGMGLSIAAA